MTLGTLGGVARANGIIDPQAKILADEFSDAIMVGMTFSPNTSGGGVFGFFNGTNQTLSEITLETTIRTNLSSSTIASAFLCNDGNANPFFMYCRVDYLASNGRLTIGFWGTNAPFDHPGVLPLPAGCTSATANSKDPIDCTATGHFAISLSDGPTVHDVTGGWSSTTNSGLFAPGQPVFTVTELQYLYAATPLLLATSTTPEPGTIGLIAGPLAGLAWFNKRRRRQ